jgi:hypothetical protein
VSISAADVTERSNIAFFACGTIFQLRPQAQVRSVHSMIYINMQLHGDNLHMGIPGTHANGM